MGRIRRLLLRPDRQRVRLHVQIGHFRGTGPGKIEALRQIPQLELAVSGGKNGIHRRNRRLRQRQRGAFLRKTERFSGTVLKQNDTVRIRTYLPGGWAQLQNGFFLETRYLEPDGDHAPTRTARVKTTSLSSRLNVRSGPDSQSPVAVKLCSGTLVEVVSQTDEWAVIGLSGTNGNGVLGCVQKKYLEFEQKRQVADGSVLARVTEELSGSDYYRPAAKTIPAGSAVRIVGVSDGYDITRPEEGDLYVILDEEGGLYWVGDNTGCFEPLEYPALKATASAAAPMRAHPRMDGEVLVKIPSGAKLEVLLRGEGFSMVRYKGQTGYVLTRQIRFR